ncbi:MAG: ammonium transporter, partial [Brachymonas sp.]|nr:ammonium transporter [Brachymonas sp.]
DVFGVHAVGGIVGALLTGVFNRDCPLGGASRLRGLSRLLFGHFCPNFLGRSTATPSKLSQNCLEKPLA